MTENKTSGFLGALAASVREHPLQPHIVLVGSNLLGAHLRHSLAEISGGHTNVRFLTFVDLAERMTRRPRLKTGRRLFPAGGEELLLRDLCAGLPSGSLFYDVRDREGFHRALRSTFHDFIDGGVTELPRLSGKLGEIAHLFHAHRKRYLPKFLATADLILEAAGAEEPFPELFGAGTLFCYGFYDLTEAQRRLLARVSQTASVRAWLPVDEKAPAMAQKTLQFFESIAKEVQKIPAVSAARLHALSAPETSAEAEETVRWLIEKIEQEKIPLHRVAILLRNPDEYAPLFAEALERANLPHYREGGAPLTDTRAGKAFLLSLDLLGTEWSRSEMIRLLTLFPFREEVVHGLGGPPDWDAWTRAAFVTAGRGNFITRMSAYAARTEKARPFLKFFDKWGAGFEKIVSKSGDWAAFGAEAAAWFSAYAREDAALGEIREICRSLGDLADLGVPPTEALAKKILRDRVQSGSLRGSVFERDGIYVGSLVSARAIPFDTVCIPGLVERSFPAPPKPDPLVLDAERKTINRAAKGAIGLREARLSEERLLFDLALSQAESSVLLSYPRLSSDHRERIPSSFFTRAAAGAGISSGIHPGIKINERSLLPWNREPAARFLDERDWISSEVGRHAAESGADATEYLAAWSPLAGPVRDWARERLESRKWGAYDGVLTVRAGQKTEKQRFSAKNIGDYATCPYQYFLRNVIKLAPLETPDEAKRLRPLDKGNLIHDILFRLFTSLRDGGLLPLQEKHRHEIERRLTEIAEEQFTKTEERFPTGSKALWAAERHFILSDLRALLDLEIREAALFQPEAFEVRFGLPSRAGQEEDARLSTDRPVPVDLEGGRIELSGKIDRIDLSPDKKRARIVDYKSGALKEPRDDQFGKGKSVQLPIYLSALPALLPGVDAEASDAVLLSTSYASGFRRVHFSGATLEARRKEFHQILSAVLKGTRSGLFPPNPGKNRENCTYCDYRNICGHTVLRTYERKAGDPAAEFIFDLEEIA